MKGVFAINEQENVTEKDSLRQGMRRDLFSWLQALVFAVIILIICFTFLGRIISVDGNSMFPTLHHKDMLLLQCIGYKPKAGDVVVLNKPFDQVNAPIVKRVIATGGQTIRIDYDDGAVYVDEQRLDEPYINGLMEVPSFEAFDQLTVPKGSIFVMGDNRNASADSRDVDLGTIDERYVLGRALLVLFPFENMGAIRHGA